MWLKAQENDSKWTLSLDCLSRGQERTLDAPLLNTTQMTRCKKTNALDENSFWAVNRSTTVTTEHAQSADEDHEMGLKAHKNLQDQ